MQIWSFKSSPRLFYDCTIYHNRPFPFILEKEFFQWGGSQTFEIEFLMELRFFKSLKSKITFSMPGLWICALACYSRIWKISNRQEYEIWYFKYWMYENVVWNRLISYTFCEQLHTEEFDCIMIHGRKFFTIHFNMLRLH